MNVLCTTTISFHFRRAEVGTETFSAKHVSAVVCRLVTSAVGNGHRGVLGPFSLSDCSPDAANGAENPVACGNCPEPSKSCKLSPEALRLMSSVGPASRPCSIEMTDGSQGKDASDVSPLTVESDEPLRVKLDCCDGSAHLRVTALAGTPGDASGVGTRQRGSSVQNWVKRGLSDQPRCVVLVGTPGNGNGVAKDSEMVTGPASTKGSPPAGSKPTP